jgi:SSS family solute:Na+ symporter
MSIEIITSIIFGIIYICFAYMLRKTSTFESFAIGNGNIKGGFIFASLSATIIGPGFSLGFVNEGFNSGFLFSILACAYALQLFFIGVFVAPIIRRKFSNSFSLGDIVGGSESHNSKIIQILSGIISLAVSIGVVGVLTKAGGDIFNVFLELPQSYGAILMTLIVIFYSYFGGIKASIYTDTFQFFLFAILLPLLLLFSISTNSFDYEKFITNSVILTQNGFNSHSIISLLGLVAFFLFGDILQPAIMNRILASKNSSISAKSFIYSGIFCIFWLLLMVSLGSFSQIFTDIQPNSDKILLQLGKEFYPPVLFSLFIVAMFGIVMSSQDSIINAGSTVFTKDIIQPLSSDRKITNRKQLSYSRLATIFIGILGLIISFKVPSILQGLLFIASVWAPTMIVSILAAVFLNKHYWKSAFFSMLFGFSSSLLWGLSSFSDKFPSILIGIFISFTAYATVHITLNLKHKK